MATSGSTPGTGSTSARTPRSAPISRPRTASSRPAFARRRSCAPSSRRSSPRGSRPRRPRRPIAKATPGTTRAIAPARTTSCSAAASGRSRRRRRSCSTATSWRAATPTSSSRRRCPALRGASSRSPSTSSAGASSRCACSTWRAGGCSPTGSRTSPTASSGPTTTRRSSTRGRTRRPCAAAASIVTGSDPSRPRMRSSTTSGTRASGSRWCASGRDDSWRSAAPRP